MNKKNGCCLATPVLLLYKNTTGSAGGFKKLSLWDSSAAAAWLPLMGEVDSPQAKTEGEKQEVKLSLPQSFASQNPVPSLEGAFGLHITASAVVEQKVQAENNFAEPIGSAGYRL